MDAQAGMLARLFERSMGLGDEWEVSDVWFEERGEALQDVYSCAGRESAARALDRLCSWMMHSNVREMKTVARTLDLCQDFGHASSRNQAAIGMTSGLGSVLSKKAAMASAGTL